jgi:hypothetical protein
MNWIGWGGQNLLSFFVAINQRYFCTDIFGAEIGNDNGNDGLDEKTYSVIDGFFGG